jgi:hypothetical protein
LIWAVAGFVAVETRRPDAVARSGARSRPGGDPHGISAAEADELFQLHLQLLVGGLEPQEPRTRQRRPRGTSRPPARRA